MAPADLLSRSLRSVAARQASVYLASRVLNGVLALAQVLLVTRAVGTAEAGHFFLLWTAAWLLSTVMRFGTDGILPRAVAEAAVRGSRTLSIRRVLAAGA